MLSPNGKHDTMAAVAQVHLATEPLGCYRAPDGWGPVLEAFSSR